jgi:hypothetical protein
MADKAAAEDDYTVLVTPVFEVRLNARSSGPVAFTLSLPEVRDLVGHLDRILDGAGERQGGPMWSGGALPTECQRDPRRGH